jgi:hypothetical protein
MTALVSLGRSWAGVPWLFAVATSGCFADSVADGYYGSTDDAGAATVTMGTAAPSSASSMPASTDEPPVDGGGRSARAGDAAPASATTTTVGCDLSGRWIATDREVSTGLGAQEAAHEWLYLELGQTGDSGTVTKGLHCGGNVRGLTSVAASVDYQKTWPAMMKNDPSTGRKFTSKSASGGCAVAFEERYFILGATASYYVNPSTTMPTMSQEATGTTPGWEDWDNDGNPGFTNSVTGLATGQIYLADRKHNAWSGAIAAGASTFKLADDWNSEQDLLGYNGSQLLTETSSATRDNDASLHFVEFARLSATQATGDDATLCASIRTLAATLTPHAAN